MPATIIGNPAVVTGLYQAFNGKAAGYNTYTNNLAYAAQNGPAAYAAEIGKGFYNVPAADLAASVLTNVGIVNATLQDALVQIFTAYPVTARGQIVLNLINLLTNLEGDATYGAAATSWNQLVGSNNAYSNNPTNVADSVVNAQAVTLTAGADVLTANIFNAARGYTPGGTDSVNTLNDDDVLTGSGTNPTLNFTYGNDADTGDFDIMPTLNGIQTLNVAYAGNQATMRLDLQDSTGINAVNLSRISQATTTVQIDNLTTVPANLSISNSNNNLATAVQFLMAPGASSGSADATTLTLNRVNVLSVEINDSHRVANTGVETVNLVSEGGPNRIGTLDIEDTETLNISGAQNLTLGAFANAGGSLVLINGSTATGNLDINLNGVLSATADGTSGTNVALAVRTGTGADTIRITDDALGTTDSIDAGESNDTVALRATLSQNFTPAATGAALVNNVENLTVTRIADAAGATAQALRVDMARFAGDQVTTLSNLADAGDNTTFVLANASAGDAAGIRITHGSTGNNALASNAIVLDVDTGVTTAGVEILEGVNTDPRFNFSLNADSNLAFAAAAPFGIVSGGADVTNSVVNITLTDSDSESNSVLLNQAARHTGTLDVNAGTAGTFLNLDTVGTGYTHVTTGAAGDATTAAAAVAETRDAAVARVFAQGSTGTDLAFASVTAADFAGNLEFRLGTTNTNAQLGSGDDTVIFADKTGIRAATSGLTIQDTIAGGAGTDTIVLDGTGVMTLGASEWTNLSGVDVLRLAGVAGGTFNIRVTDQLAGQADAGGRITIVNNDGLLTADQELTANIDLRAMSASRFVTFVGNNSDLTATTVQTVIVNDVTANGQNILNGGDNGTVSEYTLNGRNFAGGAGATFANQLAADAQYVIDRNAGLAGNNNVYSIFNTAEVTVGDLQNTRNFSTITFTNDVASVQTLNLTLDSATVDALVDSNHTATATQTETLTIRAIDNAVVVGATANLNVQAGTVGGQFNLVVSVDKGADTIVTGAGADVITGGAGRDVLSGGLGNDTFVFAAGVTDTVAAAASSAGVDLLNDLVLNAGAADRIDLTVVVVNANTTVTGAVNEATFIADLNTLLAVAGGAGFDTAVAGDISAAVVVANAGTNAGKSYLVVDLDASDSFTAADFIVEITGSTVTSLTAATFI